MLTSNYLFLLLSLFSIGKSLSIAANSACSTEGIEVGSFSVSTASSYRNMSVSVLSLTVPIPLRTAQQTTTYQATAIFSSIYYDL